MSTKLEELGLFDLQQVRSTPATPRTIRTSDVAFAGPGRDAGRDIVRTTTPPDVLVIGRPISRTPSVLDIPSPGGYSPMVSPLASPSHSMHQIRAEMDNSHEAAQVPNPNAAAATPAKSRKWSTNSDDNNFQEVKRRVDEKSVQELQTPLIRFELRGTALLEHLRERMDYEILPEKRFFEYLSKLRELSHTPAGRLWIKGPSQHQDCEIIFKKLNFKRDEDGLWHWSSHPVFTKTEILRQYLSKYYGLGSEKPLMNFGILKQTINTLVKLVKKQLIQQDVGVARQEQSKQGREEFLHKVLIQLKDVYSTRDIVYGFSNQCSSVLPKIFGETIKVFEGLIAVCRASMEAFDEKRRMEIEAFLKKIAQKEAASFRDQPIPDFESYRSIEKFRKLGEKYQHHSSVPQGGKIIYQNPRILFRDQEMVPECGMLRQFNAALFISEKREAVAKLLKESSESLQTFAPKVPSLFFASKSIRFQEPRIRVLHSNQKDPKQPLLWIPSDEIKLDPLFLELEARGFGIIQGHYMFRSTNLDIMFYYKTKADSSKIFHISCELGFSYKEDPAVSLLEWWFGSRLGRYAKPSDIIRVRYPAFRETVQTAPVTPLMSPSMLNRSGPSAFGIPGPSGLKSPSLQNGSGPGAGAGMPLAVPTTSPLSSPRSAEPIVVAIALPEAEYPGYEPFKERFPPNTPYDALMVEYFKLANPVSIDGFEGLRLNASQQLEKNLKSEWHKFCSHMFWKSSEDSVELSRRLQTLDVLTVLLESIFCFQYGSEIYSSDNFKFLQEIINFKNRKNDNDFMRQYDHGTALLEGLEKMLLEFRQGVNEFLRQSQSHSASPSLSRSAPILTMASAQRHESLVPALTRTKVISLSGNLGSVDPHMSESFSPTVPFLSAVFENLQDAMEVITELLPVKTGISAVATVVEESQAVTGSEHIRRLRQVEEELQHLKKIQEEQSALMRKMQEEQGSMLREIRELFLTQFAARDTIARDTMSRGGISRDAMEGDAISGATILGAPILPSAGNSLGARVVTDDAAAAANIESAVNVASAAVVVVVEGGAKVVAGAAVR